MTPDQRLRLLELEKEKRRRASAGRESEGGDDSEGEADAPPPSAGQQAKDFAAGASRWATLGLDDVASGVMTGALEAASPTSLSDEGDSAATRFRRGQRAGVDDRRRLVDEAAKRSPTAYNTGAGAGAGLSVALAPGSAAARLLMGGLAAPGLADIDLDTPQAPAAAALGVAGGEVANKVLPPVIAGAGQLASGLKNAAVGAARAAPGAVRSAGAAARPLANRAASTIDAIADLVPESLLPAAARKSSKALRELGRAEATTAPVGELSDDELRLIYDDLIGGGVPDVPVAAPKAAPVDVPPAAAPEPVAPAPTPRAAPETVKATNPGPPPARVAAPVTARSSAGEIDAAVRAAALELGSTDIATVANKLRLPTTLVRDPLTRAVKDFAFRDAVASVRPKTTPARVPFDPLDDIAKRTIREQKGAPNTNPVAIDDAGGRSPKQVAAVGQQELWRGTYDRLQPSQRPAYIQQLRDESGLTDDQVRRRLKLTEAEWRRLSFSR